MFAFDKIYILKPDVLFGVYLKNILLATSDYFERLPDRLRPWRWSIIIFALVTTLFMAFGSTKFVIDVTVDSWFNEDDPVLRSLDEFRDQFGSDDEDVDLNDFVEIEGTVELPPLFPFKGLPHVNYPS